MLTHAIKLHFGANKLLIALTIIAKINLSIKFIKIITHLMTMVTIIFPHYIAYNQKLKQIYNILYKILVKNQKAEENRVVTFVVMEIIEWLSTFTQLRDIMDYEY